MFNRGKIIINHFPFKHPHKYCVTFEEETSVYGEKKYPYDCFMVSSIR